VTDIEREAGIRRRGLSDPNEDGVSPGAFARRQHRHHLGRGLAIEIERRGLSVRRARIGDAYEVRVLATVAIECPGGKPHRVGRAGERTEYGFIVVLAMNQCRSSDRAADGFAYEHGQGSRDGVDRPRATPDLL